MHSGASLNCIIVGVTGPLSSYYRKAIVHFNGPFTLNASSVMRNASHVVTDASYFTLDASCPIKMCNFQIENGMARLTRRNAFSVNGP
jgi:hypothetical protein